MNQEMKSILKKTVKIAGVTCFATGAIAVVTSGAALKAVCAGGKYLAETIRRIACDNPEAGAEITELPAEEMPAEPAEETAAEMQ